MKPPPPENGKTHERIEGQVQISLRHQKLATRAEVKDTRLTSVRSKTQQTPSILFTHLLASCSQINTGAGGLFNFKLIFFFAQCHRSVFNYCLRVIGHQRAANSITTFRDFDVENYSIFLTFLDLIITACVKTKPSKTREK